MTIPAVILPAVPLALALIAVPWAIVLPIRGIVPWRQGWRRLRPQEPPATFGRRALGRLCLAPCAGCAAPFIGGTP